VLTRMTTSSNLVEIVTSQIAAIKLLIGRIGPATTKNVIEMIFQADKVFVTGQGRSGLVAQCLATRLAQMGFNVHIPGHATCQKIGVGDLLVAISSSGTTRTTVEFARISRQAGAKVIVITAFGECPLVELADQVVVIPADDEDIRNKCKYIIGPSNNTLFEEAILLYADALVYILLERKGIPKSIINQRHTNLE
jgi:6-phospho 3-hexuloisomerase